MAMNCYVHAERQAQKHCAACGNLICDECDVLLADNHVCKHCLASAESVPAQMALERSGAAHALAGVANLATGAIAVPLVLGGIMGLVGGSYYHHHHASYLSTEDTLASLFFASLSGFCTFLIGALITYMVVPNELIHQKKGVLGVYGVTDYGAFLFWTSLVTLIVWICINS
jgi:hypothetical protein